MATSGDCPRGELQVISALVCKDVYVRTTDIAESMAPPPAMGRVDGRNAVFVRLPRDVLNWVVNTCIDSTFGT